MSKSNLLNAPLNIEEIDGSPSIWPWKLKVNNSTLTDNGDGTATLLMSLGALDVTGFNPNEVLHINAGGTTVIGDSNFLWDGATLAISGDIDCNGAIEFINPSGSAQINNESRVFWHAIFGTTLSAKFDATSTYEFSILDSSGQGLLLVPKGTQTLTAGIGTTWITEKIIVDVDDANAFLIRHDAVGATVFNIDTSVATGDVITVNADGTINGTWTWTGGGIDLNIFPLTLGGTTLTSDDTILTMDLGTGADDFIISSSNQTMWFIDEDKDKFIFGRNSVGLNYAYQFYTNWQTHSSQARTKCLQVTSLGYADAELIQGLLLEATVSSNNAVDPVTEIIGAQFQVLTEKTTGDVTKMVGGQFKMFTKNTAFGRTVTEMIGNEIFFIQSGSSSSPLTVTDAKGLYLYTENGTASWRGDNFSYIYMQTPSSLFAPTNWYGLYIEPIFFGTSKNVGIALVGDGAGSDIVFGVDEDDRIEHNGTYLFADCVSGFKTDTGRVIGVTEDTDATTIIAVTDHHISIQYTDTGTNTATLPAISATNHGQVFNIKDGDYNASINNITVVTTGADTVEGDVSGLIATDGECWTLVANNTTKNWEIQ